MLNTVHPSDRAKTTPAQLAIIELIYKSLEDTLKRPLRVLNVGCAQGFFSFNLAKMGAKVFGIDSEAANISFCKASAVEQEVTDVRFDVGSFDDIIAHVKQNNYDLILCLNYFCRALTSDEVSSLLPIFAEHSMASIFELEREKDGRSEAAQQHKNLGQLLNAYAFVHESVDGVSRSSDPYSSLFVASQRVWFLNGRAGKIEEMKSSSHAYANLALRKTRRYYFGDGLIVKLFRLDDVDQQSININELSNEIAFLQNPPSAYKAPRLILHNMHDREAWLVRELIPGELLQDKIRAGALYNGNVIVHDVLDQLVILESAGLYHDDVRTSNALVQPDGHAVLIDYGAINRKAQDSQWPYNSFLAFMIFTHEVFYKDAAKPFPLRAQALNPDEFPEPYRSAFWHVLALNPDAWRFADLRDHILCPAALNPSHSQTPNAGFIKAIQAMGEACASYQESIQTLTKHVQRGPSKIGG